MCGTNCSSELSICMKYWRTAGQRSAFTQPFIMDPIQEFVAVAAKTMCPWVKWLGWRKKTQKRRTNPCWWILFINADILVCRGKKVVLGPWVESGLTWGYLIHSDIVTPCGNINLDQHCLGWWCVAWRNQTIIWISVDLSSKVSVTFIQE